MQKPSCNLVEIEILGCHHRGEDQDISELDAVEIIDPVSLLKVHSGIRGKGPCM